jgi:hypothetical protein
MDNTKEKRKFDYGVCQRRLVVRMDWRCLDIVIYDQTSPTEVFRAQLSASRNALIAGLKLKSSEHHIRALMAEKSMISAHSESLDPEVASVKTSRIQFPDLGINWSDFFLMRCSSGRALGSCKGKALVLTTNFHYSHYQLGLFTSFERNRRQLLQQIRAGE